METKEADDLKPNVVTLDNWDVPVTRDLPGYGINLAMSFAEECLSRWARAKSEKQREMWSRALVPLPLDLPWPEDSNEVIEAARSSEPYRPEAGYKPDDFDRDLDEALKARKLPEPLTFRAITETLLGTLPQSTQTVISDEARKAAHPVTDGYVLEWILGASATAWGLTRTKLGRGQATLQKGQEAVAGAGWTIRLEGSGDYLHVEWWLSWGAGHPAHALAWEGAALEWLAACAPREQLDNLVAELNRRRLGWLVQANRTYVRAQLAPLVARYADSSTPRKYRYVALFSQTPEQLRRTPKTAAVVAAIQRVTSEELTDRRLPAEIPDGASPASVAKSGGGCTTVIAVCVALASAIVLIGHSLSHV